MIRVGRFKRMRDRHRTQQLQANWRGAGTFSSGKRLTTVCTLSPVLHMNVWGACLHSFCPFRWLLWANPRVFRDSRSLLRNLVAQSVALSFIVFLGDPRS